MHRALPDRGLCRCWTARGAGKLHGWRAVSHPHLHIDTYAVYSNTVNSVAFRGYGVPQLAWAYESQMDIMAERLGLDPLDIRLKNLLRRGEVFAPGDLPIDADLPGDLRRAAAAIGWGQPLPRGRGRGLACVIKAPLAPSIASALVRACTRMAASPYSPVR